MRAVSAIVLGGFLGLSGAAPALDQAVKPEIAGCAALKAKEVLSLAQACTGHTGCALVLNQQQSCAEAGRFLTKLAAVRADPRKLTSNDVAEAAIAPLTDEPARVTRWR